MSKTSGRKTSRVSRTSPTVDSTRPQSFVVGASGSWMPRNTSARVRAVASTSPPASRSTRSRASAASSGVRMPAPNQGSSAPSASQSASDATVVIAAAVADSSSRSSAASTSPRSRTRDRGGVGRVAKAETASCTSCSETPHGSRRSCRERTCSVSRSAAARRDVAGAVTREAAGSGDAVPERLRVASGRPSRSRASTSSRATRRRPWAPACRSSTRSPRPTRSSRPTTASMAARFSATKSTRLPSAARVAIRLAMVWDLPVPGGPWTTRCEPERTASMASCWLLSASSTSTSRSGSSRSTRLRSSSERTARRASGSPARAATTSWSARASPWAARSATIGSLAYENVPTTSRGVTAKSGTPAQACARAAYTG